MLLFWAVSALAGNIYFNDVLVDTKDLAGAEFEGVKITFDQRGQLFISAPGYVVEVVEKSSAVGVSSEPRGDFGSVSAGTWWLVVEDMGSSARSVEVMVNGRVAAEVLSGEQGRALDLAPLLRPGANDMTFCQSEGQGSIAFYVGRGRRDGGVVIVDSPLISHQVEGARQATEEYVLQVAE
jgi:hypothetical protein